MRHLSITVGLVLSLAMLTFSAQPVFAASMAPSHSASTAINAAAAASCYANSYVVTDAWIVSGNIELRWCDNLQSNFARVYWNGPGTFTYGYAQINRESGRDGGFVLLETDHTIAPGSYIDSPIVYSPHNADYACGEANGFNNCTYAD